MVIELLVDNFYTHKIVAKWYFDEWLSSVPNVTIDRVENKLAKAINRETAPLMVLAKDDDHLLGAAELKIREMDIYPQYEHWLGGVYVEESARGQGVGKALTLDVINRARKAGIGKLYLQTESLSGGLYADCGFKPIEEVEYKGYRVLVMVADLEV